MRKGVEFLKWVNSNRKSDPDNMEKAIDDFSKIMNTSPEFKIIVEKIIDNNNKWAKKVGLLETDDVQDGKLTKEQEIWKRYFSDHRFESTEMQRTIADLVYILAGEDVGKFININKKSEMGFFAPLTILVPTKKTDGHNYLLETPAMCLQGEDVFINVKGSHGNNMTQNLKYLKLPTKEEVEHFLLRMFFKHYLISESIVTGILGMNE